MGFTPVKPVTGFKADRRQGRAWCPYCADALEYVWDGLLHRSRCPGCGVSTRDFHVKNANGFWSERLKQQFDDGVRRSGRSWTKGGKKMISQRVFYLLLTPEDQP